MYRNSEYKDLIDTMYVNGYKDEEVKEIIKQKEKQKSSMRRASENMSVRKTLLISDIDKYRGLKITQEEREQALHKLGIDITFPFFLDFGKINDNNNSQFLSWHIWGQERLDEEWIKVRDRKGRRYASDEAIYYSAIRKDKSILKDIGKLSLGGT